MKRGTEMTPWTLLFTWDDAFVIGDAKVAKVGDARAAKAGDARPVQTGDAEAAQTMSSTLHNLCRKPTMTNESRIDRQHPGSDNARHIALLGGVRRGTRSIVLCDLGLGKGGANSTDSLGLGTGHWTLSGVDEEGDRDDTLDVVITWDDAFVMGDAKVAQVGDARPAQAVPAEWRNSRWQSEPRSDRQHPGSDNVRHITLLGGVGRGTRSTVLCDLGLGKGGANSTDSLGNKHSTRNSLNDAIGVTNDLGKALRDVDSGLGSVDTMGDIDGDF
ncbi:unnamed protein product [Ilex paraguariensis]|uniref:Uncharacterized protein n=1 Tax=Ilex paraguariensis TaxID=185542 RepID=A0ABC8TKA0_9AQUA